MPTNIKRYFRGKSRPKVFPIRKGSDGDIKTSGTPPKEETGIRCNYPSLRVGGGNNKALISRTLASRDWKGENNLIQIGIIGQGGQGGQGQRVYDPEGNSCAVNAQGGGAKTGLYDVSRIPLKYLARNQKNIVGNYAFTVDGTNTGGIKTPAGIRRLTPLECERLQGFPDNWTGELSDIQRYKCLGSAVSIPVVAEIGKRLSDGVANGTQAD